jgi:hypothetical protein
LSPIPPTINSTDSPTFGSIHPDAILCVIDEEAVTAYKNSD